MAKKRNDHTAASAALGLAALAAAAAGAYFLYGKDAPKRRAKVRGWALRAKGEVLEAIEGLKGTLNEQQYRALVDKVMSRYKKVKQASPQELMALSKELKGHWRSIHKHLTAAGGATMKSASRIRKTASPRSRSSSRRKTTRRAGSR